MLQDEEFGSDSSDEDYKPGGESDVSEEEGEGDPEDIQAGEESSVKSTQKGKRKRKQTTNPRKKKVLVLEGEEGTAPEKDAGNEELKKAMETEKQLKKEEEEKKKADDLFADFMKDVSRPKPRPKPAAGGGLGSLMTSAGGGLGSLMTSAGGGGAGSAQKAAPAAARPAQQSSTVTVTKVFDFAGETVTVTKDVEANSREAKKAAATADGTSSSQSTPKTAPPLRRGGMAGLVRNLGKAPKMSVLEKSRLDWVGFKKEENIEEELDQHKRSKNSYLEKQDFLQRADQRQFELEKAVRDRHRTPR